MYLKQGMQYVLFNIGCLINQDFPNFEPNIFQSQIRANSESLINTIPRNNMTMISPTQSLNCPQTISEKIEEIKQLQAEQRKLRA